MRNELTSVVRPPPFVSICKWSDGAIIPATSGGEDTQKFCLRSKRTVSLNIQTPGNNLEQENMASQSLPPPSVDSRIDAEHEPRSSSVHASAVFDKKSLIGILAESGGRASETVRRTGLSIRSLADDYPLQFIAVSAGVAFVAGALFRIWRPDAS